VVNAAEPLPSVDTAAPSRRSLFALSWLNFFLAGMQSAFGPIAAAYLAAQQWTAKDIGFVLSKAESPVWLASCPAVNFWTPCGPNDS
jgi:hypothetical protein